MTTGTKHSGTCHCGVVRFEVTLDIGDFASRCNCTICTKLGLTSRVVAPALFTLLEGEGSLGMYEWGGRTGQRYFCKHCGVHCFLRGHLEVLDGDYVSVYLNCLDGVDVAELKVQNWDGRHDNWGAGPRDEPWPIFTMA